MTNRSRSVSVSLAICALFMSMAPTVSADSLITITGVFDSIQNNSYAFDGTNHTSLPGLFDGLTGGTFYATYFVPTVTPPSNPFLMFITGYTFSPPYGMKFTLYDKNGVAVVKGTGDTKDASATVWNNRPINRHSWFLGYYDGVALFGTPSKLTGLQKPAALYGKPVNSIGQDSFWFDNSSALTHSLNLYLPDLNLPTDAATYLKFPQKTFSVGAFWGSGDYTSQVNPFQYDDSHIYYAITGVSIKPVP